MDTERETHHELPPGWEGWRQNLLSTAALRRHAVWLLAACASGLGAYLFNVTEQASEDARRWMNEISPLLPALAVALSLPLICWLRDRIFPGTDGTGIPQTMAALSVPDGEGRRSVLSLRITVGKILLLVLGLFGGATIGREGPSVHVGACLMHLSGRFADFQRHLVDRGLILAGGAAGIAAAFNAPIAGAVFAFEEIGRSFEKNNAGTIVRTAVIACLVNIVFLGDYYFYGDLDVGLDSLQAWLCVPIVGALGGLLGGGFARGVILVNQRLTPIRKSHPHALAVGLGASLGILGLLSGGLSYGSGYGAAREILIEGGTASVALAPAVAVGNFLSLVSGIPGGLFDPSLTTGAALGQLAGPFFPALDPRALVLLFMGAYFAGVVQSPITAFVILVEMTGSHKMALPLSLATLIAYEISHLVCRTALYEALAESFLEAIGSRRG